MLRTICVLAAGLAIAAGPPVFAQGMPMGTMKTTNDRDDELKAALDKAPQQAMAPEPATPTYQDTPEDRLMREKTDDGAHDGTDMKR